MHLYKFFSKLFAAKPNRAIASEISVEHGTRAEILPFDLNGSAQVPAREPDAQTASNGQRRARYVTLLDDLKFVQTHTQGAIGQIGEVLGSLRSSANNLSFALDYVVSEVEGKNADNGSLRQELDRTQEIAHEVNHTLQESFTEQRNLTSKAGLLVGQINQSAMRTQKVVKSTQILALNTMIEGHRLGEVGRVVMVLADSVETINLEVQEINGVISKFSSQLEDLLPDIDQSAAGVSDHISKSLAKIEASIDEVFKRHEQLLLEIRNTTNDSAACAKKINEDLAQALVQLQFSDRISQVIERVKFNLVELLEEVAPEEAAQWRDSLGAQSLSAALTYDDPDGLESGEINFL